MLDFTPFISLKGQKRSNLSNWSIGEHIEHSCKVPREMLLALKASTPGEKRPTFNVLRSIVFFFSIIPRGKGQAPEQVLPKTDLNAEELKDYVLKTPQIESEILELPGESWLEHPVFGILNRNMAYRFIQVHHHHHLKIVMDIKDQPDPS